MLVEVLIKYFVDRLPETNVYVADFRLPKNGKRKYLFGAHSIESNMVVFSISKPRKNETNLIGIFGCSGFTNRVTERWGTTDSLISSIMTSVAEKEPFVGEKYFLFDIFYAELVGELIPGNRIDYANGKKFPSFTSIKDLSDYKYFSERVPIITAKDDFYLVKNEETGQIHITDSKEVILLAQFQEWTEKNVLATETQTPFGCKIICDIYQAISGAKIPEQKIFSAEEEFIAGEVSPEKFYCKDEALAFFKGGK